MEKKQMYVVVIVAIIVIAAVGIGVYQLTKNSGNPESSVVDSRGRTVNIDPDDIDTILCINSCSLELVSYFGSVDKVCAIDSNDAIVANKTYTQVYKNFFSSLEKVTVSNSEEIIKLNPSIVISSTISVEDLNNEQAVYGVPVYGINADIEFGSNEWFDQITKLGVLLNEKSRASELVNGVKEMISELSESSVNDISGYTCGMMFYGTGTFLKTSGDYLPFDLAGVKNVMPTASSGNMQPYNTTIEEVLKTSFDYVIVDGSNLTNVVSEIKGLLSSTDIGKESAFVNGDVYKVLVYKIWGTQFDNQLINCFYVASIVNEDYTWDFEDKANEVLKLFYGEDAISYADLANATSFGGCGVVNLS